MTTIEHDAQDAGDTPTSNWDRIREAVRREQAANREHRTSTQQRVADLAEALPVGARTVTDRLRRAGVL